MEAPTWSKAMNAAWRNPEQFPGNRHRFDRRQEPWRKDDFFLISLC
jgi:hypothetical protein